MIDEEEEEGEEEEDAKEREDRILGKKAQTQAQSGVSSMEK